MDTTSNKPLAVVTGASSGIGYELAKQFATNGFDLIVAAEDEAVATPSSVARSTRTSCTCAPRSRSSRAASTRSTARSPPPAGRSTPSR